VERLILAAATGAVLALPALAEPYHEFVDLTRRDTVGTTVIRAFPTGADPSFTLLLERRSAEMCIVWLEFAPHARPR
jgi:hypothetical protein